MKITPTQNRVFIEPVVDQKSGLIVLAPISQTEHLPHKGIVRSIAPNAKAFGKPVEFKVGDQVIFNRHYQNYDNGLKTDDGSKLTIIDAEHVLAVIP